MKTTVLYHRADFDGIFCREIAKKFLPEAELIGWDYGDAKIPFPHEGPVYVLDLSPDCFTLTHDNLPMCDDERFGGNFNRTVWIDHHKSAIEKFPAYVSGYRIDGVAACRLAWNWFYYQEGKGGVDLAKKEDYVNRDVVEPIAVRLAGEYDIWDKRDPDAELFQHGLRSRELNDWYWDQLLSFDSNSQVTKTSEIIDGLLDSGRAIQYATTHQNESIIKVAGFTIQFEGLTFLACNHARYNSQLFTAGLKPEHDACFGFAWRDGKWNVSLYHAPGKEQHDLSAIAVKYGGGGHKGACGFRVDRLPFLP